MSYLEPHELANLIDRFTEDMGAHDTRLHTFENFCKWLKEQDTNTNPYRYREPLKPDECLDISVGQLKAHKDRGPGFTHFGDDNCGVDETSNQRVMKKIDSIPECDCNLGDKYD